MPLKKQVANPSFTDEEADLVMEGYFVQGDAISDKVKSTNQVS
jgi:hypothetical protein